MCVRKRLVLFCLTALAACAAAAAAYSARPAFDGARIESSARLPDFTLHDQAGRKLSLSDERGKLVLLTFLYTHCKDVCPLTAQNLSAAVRSLGAGRRDVRVLAVSVDPKGDTPAAVRHFVRVHRLVPEFRYLTGTKRELAPIWHAYNVTSVQRAGDDIDHTLYIVLADRRGMPRVLYDATATPTAVAHDLRLLLDT
jgi:protein SCO1/2